MKEIEDVFLKKANKHHGDINEDVRFDCETNCPYCNDEKICIKRTDIYLMYGILQYEIVRAMKCLLCGNEFWEIWGVNGIDDDDEYFNYETIVEEYILYSHTVLNYPDGEIIIHRKFNSPTFRRLTPEIVDIFASGPIESRFDILEL